MMLWLLLTAVVATDIAVAVLFFAWRGRIAALSVADDASAEEPAADPLARLRDQAHQARAAIGRERVELSRMLTDLGPGTVQRVPAPVAAPAPLVAVRPTPASPSSVTRRDVLNMAADGLSVRGIAARAGMSVEEVRLMLALEEAA